MTQVVATTDLERILACPNIPTMPGVAMRILDLTRAPEFDLKEIARAIEIDQALSSRILRTVNSPYYGLSHRCSTIQQALVYLGVNTVKTIVLSFTLVKSLGGAHEGASVFDFADYWRKAILTGSAMREIARKSKACPPEEAFLVGLLQDLGMIALYRAFGRHYLEVLAAADGDHRRLLAIEGERLGTDHAQVGAALIARWRLPEQFVEAIRLHHHDSGHADSPHSALLRVAALAEHATSCLLRPDAPVEIEHFRAGVTAQFDMSLEEADDLLEAIADASESLAEQFDLGATTAVDARTILLQAQERLLEHQRRLDREAELLRQSNRALIQTTLTDPLTGIANRAHFDLELARRFQHAVAEDRALGLIFCDLDHFKALNDTHGHQVGDAALAAIAQVMQQLLGSDCTLARYGGEEFAIILPDMDRRDVTLLAEKLRRSIEAESIDVSAFCPRAQPMRVTASLGVASYDATVRYHITSPELLIRVADKAVYAAKSAGRNCVRIYAPKVAAAMRG